MTTHGLVGQRVVVRRGNGHLLLADEGGRALGQAKELWLEDVGFFVSGADKRAVGVVLAPRRPEVVRKNGWSAVRVDAGSGGCFHRTLTGACVRAAKYARLRPDGIDAFGIVAGDPMRRKGDMDELRRELDLPVLGPVRKSWRGDMGGLNFEIATPEVTAQAIRDTLGQAPHSIIVDGSDDWNAPIYCKPELLVARYGVAPSAWWHTGSSGQSFSGVVLPPSSWVRFRREFVREFGFPPERCPGPKATLERPPCGCWKGEGLRIYRL